MWLFVPETKGIPLEEMARIFGDEVAVYENDIYSDHKPDELDLKQQGAENKGDIKRIGYTVGNSTV